MSDIHLIISFSSLFDSVLHHGVHEGLYNKMATLFVLFF